MGKIADFLEQLRQDEEKERERTQTVASFAKELKKSSELLMEQLQSAGVKKASETEQITEADKESLLRYLQKKYGKGLTIKGETEEQRIMKAVAAQENGAEWECLELFTLSVLWGHAIDPAFQDTVNLVVAKSFIYQALPLMKRGRPKSSKTEDLGQEISQKYWDLRDGGTSYSTAAQRLADEFHKDERHIMRLVEKHKKSVGLTFEDRERERMSLKLPRYSNPLTLERLKESLKYVASVIGSYPALSSSEFEPDDYIEYFDERIEQIVKNIQAKTFPDIK